MPRLPPHIDELRKKGGMPLFATVWDRFRANWGPLSVLGIICAIVLQLPRLVVVPLLIGSGSAFAAAALSDPSVLMAELARSGSATTLISGVLLAALVLVAFSIIANAFAQGTMLAAARRVHDGDGADVVGSVQEGLLLFPRMLAYLLLASLTIGAVGLVNVIPMIGQLLFLIALTIMVPAFGYFGAYALATGETDVGGAYRLAWHCMTKRLGDTAQAGFILFAMLIVMAIGSFIVRLSGPAAGALDIGLYGLFLAASALMLSAYYEQRLRGRV